MENRRSSSCGGLSESSSDVITPLRSLQTHNPSENENQCDGHTCANNSSENLVTNGNDLANACGNLHMSDGGIDSGLSEVTGSEDIVDDSPSNDLSLSSQGLDSIPESLLTVAVNLEKLDLAYNSLVTIPDSLCQCLSNVTVLSLAGNDIEELPSAISLLHELCDLDLSGNKISAFPSSIVTLLKLQSINFATNTVELLPAEFGRLTALETIIGYENQLRRLPDTFGLLRRLTALELGDNLLISLPRNFGFLRMLKTLNLSNNKLEKLPDNVCNLEMLEFMDLSGNLITSLPERFHASRSLRRLFVDGNRMKALPMWFADMPELEELGLKDNHLVENVLPEQFGDVSSKLRLLEIAGNYVTHLPESLGHLKHLERIHIGSMIDELERANFQNGNWIWKLPANFGQLSALRHANLNENQICELPANFGELACLEWLDLGQNRLVDLPESFGNLRSLKFCQISKNKLEILPSSFGNLSSLEELRLDHNLLAELPESFSRLTQLKTLDLFTNRLLEIPKFLETFTQLTRLDLNENSFGLHYSRVPLLTKPNRYAPRDPNLRDNWRGRRRVDLIAQQVDKVVDADENYDPDNEEPPEVPYNNFALENAVRKNMSLWRSHGMQGERPRYPGYNDEDDTDSETGKDDVSPSLNSGKVDKDNDEEWSCDEKPESESMHSGSNRRTSTASRNSHPSSGDAAQVAMATCDTSQQQEEDWDSEIVDVIPDSSPFDLDDGNRFVTLSTKPSPSFPDFRLNPFFCLPAVLHTASYRTYKDQYSLLASAITGITDSTQFDDA